MKIIKIVKTPQIGKDRWMVSIYLDCEIKWENLMKRCNDIEFNEELDNYPVIKTKAGTIFYLRKSIRIMNPYTDDVNPLVDFAMSKLDGRKKSKSWFEFVSFWRNEVRDLDNIEKKIIKELRK